MVALRLDPRLSGRVDASDVVQEALIDIARKLAEYERERPLPFYPWLHRLTSERLAIVHRQHRRGIRSVGRERICLGLDRVTRPGSSPTATPPRNMSSSGRSVPGTSEMP